ncbi:dihydroxyacetone kinase transcriptional activator DhaS [Vagococcus salmoninarum]|uniref:dihydroxyacetone kinase transcriptional activator DhaS n=1 Tax=Vagococcus salmoninarum TaxID=2739 RepID=UPI00187FDE4E|nr:dihydroxyacetone kinase transcriptional activator DhaS [Vagococcus salmoninarum]MBE9387783.1 dihydroxyacetone kinase transcriptional activator DhaS [Vagococcus salmoninarum]
MQESLITKKIIAYALKSLMTTTPFTKITIRQIMETADIRRQTFYNHFQDKYELLTWIYQQEISENISDFLDYEEWHNVILRILDYFYHNQPFYRNAFAFSEQNSFDHYFLEHTNGLIKTIASDITKKAGKQLAVSQLTFPTEFYSHAFVGVTKNWLTNGCPEEPVILAAQISTTLENALAGALIP